MENTATHTEILENGLTVFLKEMHSAPLISHWVWYRAGSRLERAGQRGISHWVEHMQFKGTPKHAPGSMDKAISRVGGVWNAFTFIDWTTYFETLPASQIRLALEVESDRMRNSSFKPEDVEAERTVIISELEGSENEPTYRLGKAVQSAAFQVHPYGNQTIGTLEDLRSITRNDLYGYYQSHYLPNNAVVSLAGDFDTRSMLALVKKYYSSIQPGAIPDHVIPAEPPADRDQYLEVKGPGEATFIEVMYKAPQVSQDDFYSLMVLDSLLTGPSSLNMFGGGGTSNKTSRLYKRLVERSRAVVVGGGLQVTIDPHAYEISMTMHPRASFKQVIRTLDQEIDRFQQRAVKQEEIDRAVKQARAIFTYGSENITNQAFWMGFSEMFASYDWFLTYLERLSAVTPQQLQGVAQKYLRPDKRVTGVYIPTGREDAQ